MEHLRLETEIHAMLAVCSANGAQVYKFEPIVTVCYIHL